MFMVIKAYNKLEPIEEKAPAASTTKICSECAMEIPVAAKKCPYCGNTEL
jgi:large conductance mechanosensitive channel